MTEHTLKFGESLNNDLKKLNKDFDELSQLVDQSVKTGIKRALAVGFVAGVITGFIIGVLI